MDRAKDIVIRGGENIGCAEVEYAISEHPAVNEVSVFGVPDERVGRSPYAVVMLKSNSELSDRNDSISQTQNCCFQIPSV